MTSHGRSYASDQRCHFAITALHHFLHLHQSRLNLLWAMHVIDINATTKVQYGEATLTCQSTGVISNGLQRHTIMFVRLPCYASIESMHSKSSPQMQLTWLGHTFHKDSKNWKLPNEVQVHVRTLLHGIWKYHGSLRIKVIKIASI